MFSCKFICPLSRRAGLTASATRPGIASLPTILVLMALIISVGIFISAISLSDSSAVSGLNSSNQALNFAQSGAKDALEKIVRDKDYAGSYLVALMPDGCTEPYAGCATVNVTAGVSPKIITAEGRLGDLKRNIQVDVNLDVNGLIIDYDWQEL